MDTKTIGFAVIVIAIALAIYGIRLFIDYVCRPNKERVYIPYVDVDRAIRNVQIAVKNDLEGAISRLAVYKEMYIIQPKCLYGFCYILNQINSRNIYLPFEAYVELLYFEPSRYSYLDLSRHSYTYTYWFPIVADSYNKETNKYDYQDQIRHEILRLIIVTVEDTIAKHPKT